MNCVGSTTLIKSLGMQSTDEPDYLKAGTAAHAALAHLLANPDVETWELAGEKFGDVVADQEMLDAVDVGVRTCRGLTSPGVKTYIEHHISAPEIHAGFFGTVDFATVSESLLNVVDYKHGEVPVEVEDNPQLKYYAYGLLLRHPAIRRVVLRIVQPRVSYLEPVRRWETTAEALGDWASKELIPAMDRAGKDKTLNCGDWCRFCPAKLVCPLMRALFEAASTHDPKEVVNLPDAVLGQSYKLVAAAKSYLKALEDETYKRNMAGQVIPGTKLVAMRARRVFKPGADAIFRQRFGAAAMEPAELKSPAQMEQIDPVAKEWVKQWAYAPASGLTLALESDKREGIRPAKPSTTFAEALEKLT